MSNVLERISESTKYVSDNSSYVKINYEVIDKVLEENSLKNPKYWMESNPFGLLDMELRDIINFLLVYHTVGLCCFWGEPKWELVTEDGKKTDGSFGLVYALIGKFKDGMNYDMDYEEFKNMLKGNVDIPLVEERYECFVKMSNYLKTIEGDFYDQVKEINDDETLLDYIIANFDFFEDISEYKGKKIYFYKKAQLFTSDILNVKKLVGKIDVDLSHLVGCADYKIPQVMRCLGMIEFNEELSSLVDSMKLIPSGSEMEVEIRANDIAVIDYIYKKLNSDVTRINVNDFIWLLGQDKSKMVKPYHRTKTMNY